MSEDVERSRARPTEDVRHQGLVRALQIASVFAREVERRNEISHAALGDEGVTVKGGRHPAGFLRRGVTAVGIRIPLHLHRQNTRFVESALHRERGRRHGKCLRRSRIFNADLSDGSRFVSFPVLLHDRHGLGKIRRDVAGEVPLRRREIGRKGGIRASFLSCGSFDHDFVGLPRTVEFERKSPVLALDVVALNHHRSDAVARRQGPVVRERLEFVDGVSPEDRVFRDREAKNVGNAVEGERPALHVHHDRRLLGFPRRFIPSAEDAAVVTEGKVRVGRVIVRRHVPRDVLHPEVERRDVVVRIRAFGERNVFGVRIPIGEDVAGKACALKHVDALHEGALPDVDRRESSDERSGDVEVLHECAVQTGLRKPFFRRTVRVVGIENGNVAPPLFDAVSQNVGAEIETGGHALRTERRDGAAMLNPVVFSVGDENAQALLSVRGNHGVGRDSQHVSRTFQTNARSVGARRQKVGRLRYVVVASVNVKTDPPGVVVGHSDPPAVARIVSVVVGIGIDEDPPILFRFAALIDRVPEPVSSIDRKPQILHDGEFRLHRHGPIAPVLMAQQAVLQFKVTEFRIEDPFIMIRHHLPTDDGNTVHAVVGAVVRIRNLGVLDHFAHVLARKVHAVRAFRTFGHYRHVELVAAARVLPRNDHPRPGTVAVDVAQSVDPDGGSLVEPRVQKRNELTSVPNPLVRNRLLRRQKGHHAECMGELVNQKTGEMRLVAVLSERVQRPCVPVVLGVQRQLQQDDRAPAVFGIRKFVPKKRRRKPGVSVRSRE